MTDALIRSNLARTPGRRLKETPSPRGHKR